MEFLGYSVNKEVLQLADYGVPQSRRRLVLLAGKGFHILMPKRTHCEQGDKKVKLKPWLTLADALTGNSEPVTLSTAIREGGPQKFNWHVVRDLTETSVLLYKATKPGSSRYSLPMNLRPNCHRNRDKGFPNVYGRLSWDQVPPTITGGCTTPAKGRFGYPNKLRTISVREAAFIQTFPEKYKFVTEFMDTVCDLVGNALPPIFSETVAETCFKALSLHSGGS